MEWSGVVYATYNSLPDVEWCMCDRVMFCEHIRKRGFMRWGFLIELEVLARVKPVKGVVFFRGVATIVIKLFNIVESVFGKTDYQQWRLIQRMSETQMNAIKHQSKTPKKD
ncbi:hypothetical protein YC2023_020342 [Brassica napus]